jgi:putative hemolysin
MSLLTAIVFMVILLLLKGFFSGSEIALVSVDKIQMHHRARMGDRGARLFLRIFQRPDRMLTITLIGTNLATVALASIGTVLMIHLFGSQGDLYAFLLYTPIFLIFGEIVPKSIYQQKAESVVPVIVYPLKAASLLFYPVTFVFSYIARVATRLVGSGKAAQSVFLTREQLRAVLEMTEKRSDVAAFTAGRIRKAIRFGDTQAAEIMTPLGDLPLFARGGRLKELALLAKNTGYRPVPIYEGNTANVIGIVSLAPWEISRMDLSGSIDDLVHPPFYTAPRQTLGRLLPVLKKREDQTAMIVDEFGSATGMVTLEDILEVVVGRVKLSYHYEKHPYRRKRTFEIIEDGVYLLDARLPISEVNDVIGLNLSTDDYRTVGGMLLAQLRHIPREGEYIVDSGYRFTVTEATEKSVVQVRAEPET